MQKIMHLDWELEFVIAVTRLSIACATKDSACSTLDMSTCFEQSVPKKIKNTLLITPNNLTHQISHKRPTSWSPLIVDCCAIVSSAPFGDKSNNFSPFPLSERISNIDMQNDL